MNFSQLGKIQELKGHMDTFRRNHPKFPMFLGAVAQNAVEEGTIIEINVTAPNGAHYETNLKLRAEDLEFIRALQEMGNKKCKKIEKSTCIFKKSMIRYYSCQR